MPLDPRQLFAGIGQAKVTISSDYIREGIYWMRIDKCKLDESRVHKIFWANEMTVVRVIDNHEDKGHKLGDEVTHMVMRDNDYFLPDAKQFACSALGVTADQVPDAEMLDAMETIYGTPQALVGMVMQVSARLLTGKQSGKDFTKVKYEGEISPARLLKELNPETISRFFPGNMLQKTAAALGNAPAA